MAGLAYERRRIRADLPAPTLAPQPWSLKSALRSAPGLGNGDADRRTSRGVLPRPLEETPSPLAIGQGAPMNRELRILSGRNPSDRHRDAEDSAVDDRRGPHPINPVESRRPPPRPHVSWERIDAARVADRPTETPSSEQSPTLDTPAHDSVGRGATPRETVATPTVIADWLAEAWGRCPEGQSWSTPRPRHFRRREVARTSSYRRPAIWVTSGSGSAFCPGPIALGGCPSAPPLRHVSRGPAARADRPIEQYPDRPVADLLAGTSDRCVSPGGVGRGGPRPGLVRQPARFAVTVRLAS